MKPGCGQAWLLFQVGTLSNIYISDFELTTHSFFELESSVALNRVIFEATNNKSAAINNNGSTTLNVQIRDCTFLLAGALLYNVGGVISNWAIENNLVQMVYANDSVLAHMLTECNNCAINKNVFISKLGGAGFCGGLYLFDCTFTDIKDNSFYLDDGLIGGTAIFLSSTDGSPTCQYVNIENNKIGYTVGATSQLNYGIFLNGCADIYVKNNIVKNMHTGIACGPSSGASTCHHIYIDGNQIEDSYHCGIALRVEDFGGTVPLPSHYYITNNNIDTIAYTDTAASGGVYTNAAVGIYVSIEDPSSTGIAGLYNLKIRSNTITLLANGRASGRVYGVHIETDLSNAVVTSYSYIDITHNTIHTFDSTTSSDPR